MVGSLPTTTARLVRPVIEPHHSTVSQLPRVYLYCSEVCSGTSMVTSQMPLPWLVMSTSPGFHGPSASMLPGTNTRDAGGVSSGTRTRKVTATSRAVAVASTWFEAGDSMSPSRAALGSAMLRGA
jgi:hypothetical protein